MATFPNDSYKVFCLKNATQQLTGHATNLQKRQRRKWTEGEKIIFSPILHINVAIVI